MTLIFNKPIILPPIKVENLTSTTFPARLLEASNDKFYYDIKDVIDLSVESSFYEKRSQEIEISNYTATRLTNSALDIQVYFTWPLNITRSVAEPDDILVRFKKGRLFMAEDDFS